MSDAPPDPAPTPSPHPPTVALPALPTNLRARYVAALLLLAILALGAFTAVTYAIDQQRDFARIINTSGRQRMLSQRTALLALELASAESDLRRTELRVLLRDAVDAMAAAHQRLVDDDSALSTSEVGALYRDEPVALDRKVRDHLTRVEEVLALDDGTLDLEQPALQRLLAYAGGPLLRDLDRAVELYEAEATRRTARLRSTETAVLLTTLTALLLVAVLIFRPLERRVRMHAAELRELALYDPLTGLANRVLLTERLEQALRRTKRHPDRPWALLYLDLDGFKPINDRLGHAAGDQLLTEVATRLGAAVREVDTVARLGGDEFAIHLDQVTTPEDARRVAERIRAALAVPFAIGDERVTVGTSIGLLDRPQDYADAAALLEDADAAMYRAKRSGRDRTERVGSPPRSEARPSMPN